MSVEPPASRHSKQKHLRRILKERLALSNINDLVLCQHDYNLGMFGCIIDEEEGEAYMQDCGAVGGLGSIYEDSQEARQARDNFLRLKLGAHRGNNHVGECGSMEPMTSY